ncbi:hypothetical protein Abor_017_014 [Acetobacter orientalis]|uniref:Uncharacterized protein n=1 Tax=Acetobacter orientalis TaxID=146474 RepID=A0A2Z5ZDU5_9PROT|nr:hypothetical protein Abor_017_014 [Acetobacter orientalis]GAN66158.1 hypothetical protein Abor_017_014 [Acetobacter orientalis]GBR16183.1 hypothetical protein AA0481_1043 [Acetobacter orientalis NRIC 0481]GEL61936.1 hypothetical protein AOR02nite_17780 [Acetobacter orientalis]
MRNEDDISKVLSLWNKQKPENAKWAIVKQQENILNKIRCQFFKNHIELYCIFAFVFCYYKKSSYLFHGFKNKSVQ